tara:strand:+ start:3065 stop:3877 length:813 start_codon:yes stop_codon:yes gene_type:complete
MEIYALYLCLGLVAGLISGLFGLSGGVVIVPILIFTFTAQGFSPDVLTYLAIGTSLATIVVTSSSSILAHQKRGAVLWPVVIWLTPGIIVGAAFGAIFAVSIGGPSLQLGFGVFLCLVAMTMVFPLQPDGVRTLPGVVGKSVMGAVIGFVSSIFGIGGGSLSVPGLSWFKVSMKNAVATSAACGLPIAVSGVVTYLIQGWGEVDLPAGARGFVYLPAFIGIVCTSTFSAKWGAKLAHQLPAFILRKGFSLLLLIIGARFIWRNAGLILLG